MFDQGVDAAPSGSAGGACWPAIVAAARSCVGTSFRSQGRSIGLGLDCIGVALIAASASGLGPFVAPTYAMGGDHEAEIDAALARLGCAAVACAEAGDILVCAPAPKRRHLAVVTSSGAVHAHAGLGRVVEGPIDPGWSIVGAWRLPGAR